MNRQIEYRACRQQRGRILRIIAGLRYCGLDHEVPTYQRRLAWLRRIRSRRHLHDDQP